MYNNMHYFSFAFVQAIQSENACEDLLAKNPFERMKIADDFTHFGLFSSVHENYTHQKISLFLWTEGNGQNENNVEKNQIKTAALKMW